MSLGAIIVVVTFFALLYFRGLANSVESRDDKGSVDNATLNNNEKYQEKPVKNGSGSNVEIGSDAAINGQTSDDGQSEDRSGGNIGGGTTDAGSDTTNTSQRENSTNRFTVYYNKEAFQNELRLGQELIMVYKSNGEYSRDNNDADCMVRSPATPVVNQDGSKVYFVSKDAPNQVKVMDVRKNVSVVYTAPANYPFVASITLGAGDKLAYTLFDRTHRYCSNRETEGVRLMYVIDGKTISVLDGPSLVTREVAAFGKNYYVTITNFNGLGFCGSAGVRIWKIADNSLIYDSFGPLVHNDVARNEVFVYGETGCGPMPSNSLKKVNLDTGNVEHIFGGPSVYINVEQITPDLDYIEIYRRV